MSKFRKNKFTAVDIFLKMCVLLLYPAFIVKQLPACMKQLKQVRAQDSVN